MRRPVVAVLGLVLMAVAALPHPHPHLHGSAVDSSASGSAAIAIDATKQRQVFEAWGTSLCWWAVGVGAWDNATAFDEVMDLVFDPVKGLGLNLVRYNIGGGENPLYARFMRPGARVEGFQAPNGTFDWSADASQRRVLLAAAKRGANHVHAFSNSPPYWMTNSGSTTGAQGGGNNLRDDMYTAFADYLAAVVKRFQSDAAFGPVTFDAVTPINEPVSPWWHFGGDQEGCHFDRDKQSDIVALLGKALQQQGVQNVTVSGPEENSIDDSLTSLQQYQSDAINSMDLVTTHTYHGSNRGGLSSWAATHQKRLWNSEFGTGSGPLQGGLVLAQQIMTDVNEMNISAWTLWQALDLDNTLSPGGWGLLAGTYTPQNLFTVRPTGDGGLCLGDVQGNDLHNGDKVGLSACASGAATTQQWFVGQSRDAAVQLHLGNESGACLDDWGQNMQPGDEVRLYSCWNGANQRWYFEPEQGLIRLNNNSGLCLTRAGQDVSLQTCLNNGAANQTWSFLEVPEMRVTGVNNKNGRAAMPRLDRGKAVDSTQTDQYTVRKQYWAYRQFTAFVRPGARVLQVADPNGQTLAAISGSQVVVVVLNSDLRRSDTRSYSLSSFAHVSPQATAYLTDADHNCEAVGNVTITNNAFQVSVPAQSIMTIVIPVTDL